MKNAPQLDQTLTIDDIAYNCNVKPAFDATMTIEIVSCDEDLAEFLLEWHKTSNTGIGRKKDAVKIVKYDDCFSEMHLYNSQISINYCFTGRRFFIHFDYCKTKIKTT